MSRVFSRTGMFMFAMLCAMGAIVAHAQEYPARLVRIINPFPTGGPTDPPVRWAADKLTEAFGQQVIVEFKGGAAGNIGAETVARAPADGYNLLFVTSSFPLAAVVPERLPFDPIRDFTAIGAVSSGPIIFVARPALGVRSIQDLIALARKMPGKVTFASSGVGGSGHLYGEMLKLITGVNMLHIPYKGAGPAIADLLGGHVDTFFVAGGTVLPLLTSGKLVALGVGSAKRERTLPDIPTVHEAGVPGFSATSRYGLLAPAGTPRAIVMKLNTTLAKVLNTPETRQRFASLGLEPDTSTPEEFAAYIKNEIVTWTRVVKATGIQPE